VRRCGSARPQELSRKSAVQHRRSRAKVSVVFDRVSCGRSYSAETRSRLCIDGGGAAPGPVSYATLGKVRVKGCCARQWNKHTQGRPGARLRLSLIDIYNIVLSLSSKFSLRIAQCYSRYIFLEKKRDRISRIVPAFRFTGFQSTRASNCNARF